MQIAITIATIGTTIGIVLFLCLYLGFRTGLRLGMQAAKGQMPPKIPNPVQAVKQMKEDKQQAAVVDGLVRGWRNMQDYDGFLPEERLPPRKEVI
jgi:hypothetical protein